MMHHEGVVSLTIKILFSTVISQFCTGLSISLPFHKKGVAKSGLHSQWQESLTFQRVWIRIYG